jgi:hypothetical protein
MNRENKDRERTMLSSTLRNPQRQQNASYPKHQEHSQDVLPIALDLRHQALPREFGYPVLVHRHKVSLITLPLGFGIGCVQW